MVFLCQRLFSPNRNSSRRGKRRRASGNFGTSSDGSDALEPSDGILSGSVATGRIGGDWIDTRRSRGLIRDTWNDPVVLLGSGSLKTVAAIESNRAKIRKILTS